MANREETNVLVPPCAIEALNSVSSAMGKSRDATIRDLLVDFIEELEETEADTRPTHISTVLRYPLAPWRGQRLDDTAGARLRLRLPAGYIDRAKGVALRLPGQPERGGHRDYQSRLLADCVTTAVAHQVDYDDPFLTGLLPVLRHRSAKGLWQLSVAATLTIAERRAYKDAIETPDDDRAVAIADELMYGETAWHHPRRVEVIRHFARELLCGPDAAAHEWELFRQRSGGVWHQYVNELENATDFDHPLLITLPHDMAGGREGRGGTAVWRSQRLQASESIAYWLLDDSSDTIVVEPPGWILRKEPNWRAEPVPSTGPTGDLAALVAAGEVLDLRAGATRFLWPLIADNEPVPELHGRLSQLATLRPITQAVETLLVQWGKDLPHSVAVPAYKARDYGIISKPAAEDLINEARAMTEDRMQLVLEQNEDLGAEILADLAGARSTPTVFAKMCRGLDIDFHISRGIWHLEIDTLAAELTEGHRPSDLLTWLTGAARRQVNRALTMSMQDAWADGFAQGRARYFA